ncbi:uncharacterized protein BDZ99DRAFT_518629 [Mytilinidion resinicola]|uniref:Ankyrin n=1 Tax=Mytilinidion resinicola TaxID=574789 RepID=A0A6A6YRD1_9PEZI|nr:uncharacterized protein BDZ99DRAFT_518629 [Mytilinidion resinicola]KAF2811350.1 hypothetical protein BDZ99DRAFT_518629 [Mytilinidion resinicola]
MRRTMEQLCLRRGIPNNKETRKMFQAVVFTCWGTSKPSGRLAYSLSEVLSNGFENHINLLVAAASLGYLEVVKNVVEELFERAERLLAPDRPRRGIVWLREGSDFGSPFRIAAEKGHYEAVEYLLQNLSKFCRYRDHDHPVVKEVIIEAAKSCNSKMLRLSLETPDLCQKTENDELIPFENYGPIPSLDCGNAPTGVTGKDVFIQLWYLITKRRTTELPFQFTLDVKPPTLSSLLGHVNNTVSLANKLIDGKSSCESGSAAPQQENGILTPERLPLGNAGHGQTSSRQQR